MGDSFASWTYQDYSEEKSSVRFAFSPITDGASLTAVLGQIAAVKTALNGVMEETCLQSERVMLSDTFISRARATNKPTQRETKWIITLEDQVTHKLSRHEIPCAKLSLLTANTDFADLSSGAGLALKTAVEAGVHSPEGNAVFVISLQHNGKRL